MIRNCFYYLSYLGFSLIYLFATLIKMLSKFSLLFTKKSTIILYVFGALFSLCMLGVTSAQILISYANHEGFDVPATNFYYELILFVPFFITNGFLLRLLIERWRILQRSKRMTHIAEYDAVEGFTPAHAGLLIDNDIRTEEVIATLYDLERRGILAINDTAITLLITEASVTAPEKELIDVLFSESSNFKLDRSSAMLFLSASDTFRKAMLLEMREHNMLPMPIFKTKHSQRLMSLIFLIASYVSIVLFVFLIKSPLYILMVQYPRYPMNIGQPVVAILLILLVLVVACSGLISSTFTTKGRLNWRFAAGYRLYIETVFKGKFEYGARSFHDKEMKTVLPYAIAFSLEKKPVNDFLRKLGL